MATDETTYNIVITEDDIRRGQDNQGVVAPSQGCPIALRLKEMFDDPKAYWSYSEGGANSIHYRVIGGKDEQIRVAKWVEHFDESGEATPIEFDVKAS